jgi:hypothetical protein
MFFGIEVIVSGSEPTVETNAASRRPIQNIYPNIF